MRRKMIDLLQQRAALVKQADEAYQAGEQGQYQSAMEQVGKLNGEIAQVKALVDEMDRKFLEAPPHPAEERDKAGERAEALRKGEAVAFDAREVYRALRPADKSVTLATGNLVEPTGAGSNIRDPLGNLVSSIVDQVYVQDLSGMTAFQEPYVLTELDAQGGIVAANAGKARADSADPTFAVAEIKPYEVNVTSYVDRNINSLSPANYYQKIYGMAMRAMRRKVAGLILNGDGAASPTMYGIKTAKNKAGSPIYATQAVAGVDVDLLDTLYFAYGSGEAMGPFARLLLTKQDLKAIGQLRGANEKRRLMEISPDPGNPNPGTIRDGGVSLPYTICSDLTSLSAATPGAADLPTMLYGDPANYELGLFSGYSVRVDESVKAVERMYTILGDVMVGGNLIVDKGFVVATLPKTKA